LKAAVTGATGFIGRHLCDELLGRGDSVSALVRDRRAADVLTRRGISAVHGDLMDEEALCRLCSNADVVFNLAGALGKWGTSAEEMELVNVRAVDSLVRCAARFGARKVVHTSTAGVSGPLPDGVSASEEYPPRPATIYQRTKLAGERAALEAHRELGIPLVVVRPAFVYGPGDMHKLSLFQAIAAGRMILVSGGVSSPWRIHPVFVDDLVSGMLCAAERAAGSGEVYILGGAGPVTVRKLVETIAWALAVPAPKLSLPGGLLLSLARFTEMACAIARREPPLTCSRVKLLSENYAYSIDKARRELKFKPVVDLPEGARRAVEWYMGRGLLGSSRRGDRRVG